MPRFAPAMPVLEAHELAAKANELASYWLLVETRFVDLILVILHESLSVGADCFGSVRRAR
jgi:hypothetical protein